MQPQNILIAFTEPQLGQVLNALADKPYREVAPVIASISQQIQANAARQKPELVPTEPPPPIPPSEPEPEPEQAHAS